MPLPPNKYIPDINTKLTIKLGDNISAAEIAQHAPAQTAVILAGSNYGNGAIDTTTLPQLYTGVKAVAALSYAKGYASYLAANGILPLTFANPRDYPIIFAGNTIDIFKVAESIDNNRIFIDNGETGIRVHLPLTNAEIDTLLNKIALDGVNPKGHK